MRSAAYKNSHMPVRAYFTMPIKAYYNFPYHTAEAILRIYDEFYALAILHNSTNFAKSSARFYIPYLSIFRVICAFYVTQTQFRRASKQCLNIIYVACAYK